jgi:hypothetical protein
VQGEALNCTKYIVCVRGCKQLINEKQLNVFVKLPEGKTLSTQVKNTFRVSEIKRLISSMDDIPDSRVVLKVCT